VFKTAYGRMHYALSKRHSGLVLKRTKTPQKTSQHLAVLNAELL